MLPAAAYACDREGLITYFNPQAATIWGRDPALHDPADRFCGSFRIFTEDGSPLPHAECWMALTLRDDRAYEGCALQIEQPNGHRVSALAYANPVHDDRGELIGAVNVIVDVSERQELRKKIREVEQDYADFFEHGAVGLHCVGPDGTILQANRAELEMLGYARAEDVGHHIAEFHVDQGVIADMLSRLAAGETLRNYEARMLCKDGGVKHVATSPNVLWKDGKFAHTRCFTIDITAQKAAEEALRSMNTRRNEFLALLGHELRSPLEPILNAVEFLRRSGPGDPDLDEARNVIDRQVSHMARLLDDLLNTSRITQGKLKVVKETVALTDVVKSAVETVRPLLDQKGHELELCRPDEPLYLRADPVRMSQVFSNLLGNAAKYTNRGGRIRFSARRSSSEPADPGSVEFLIEDNGIGMSKRELELAFDMFVQLAEHASEPRSGLGVGLTLVRSIVELHGGEVEAESRGRGCGTRFVVRLPLTSAPAAPRAVPAPVECSPSALRILVVDDHEDSAVSLSKVLAAEGHDCRSAFDAEAALAQAEDFEPEVVVLDIGLPDMDGREACRRIRYRPWGKKALVIALTGWGQPGDKRKTRAAGFDAHLTKPIEYAVLRKLLATGRRAAG
jgi:PAS domain S-box-containing protein